MTKTKLFCFPYAGGSSFVYEKWRPLLKPEIELVPVELAGRGRRIYDTLYTDITSVIDDVFEMLKDDIYNGPYALLGHSMGSLITYELAQRLMDIGAPDPQHLFFSGKGAPNIKRADEKQYHAMADDEFRREIVSLGGTPKEFFEEPELMELFLPILKNDFKIVETYPRRSEIRPFHYDITVFMGKADDHTHEQRVGWNDYTAAKCNIHYFEGGHFFIHDETDAMVSIINQTIK